MSSDKLQRLLEFVEKSPDSPFPRYALAMECRNRGMHEKALENFRTLVLQHPDYTATYLQFGLALIEFGEAEQAAEILRTGIEIAGKNGDQHARDELSGALRQLEEE